MSDTVTLKRYFYSLYDFYQQLGGKKSIHDFENDSWKSFDPIIYQRHKIKKLILDFPIHHPLEKELHQLKKDQIQLIQTIDTETDPDKSRELENTYDEYSDTIYDMEQELYTYKKKAVKKIKHHNRLQTKIHDISNTETLYKNENVLYEILDELRTISHVLQKNS